MLLSCWVYLCYVMLCCHPCYKFIWASTFTADLANILYSAMNCKHFFSWQIHYDKCYKLFPADRISSIELFFMSIFLCTERDVGNIAPVWACLGQSVGSAAWHGYRLSFITPVSGLYSLLEGTCWDLTVVKWAESSPWTPILLHSKVWLCINKQNIWK